MAESSATKRWFHRHPVITLSGVVVFGTIFLLCLAEVAARVVVPQWAPPGAQRVTFWVYDDLLGWAHQPNQHGRFVHQDFNIDVKINSDGLRDDGYDLKRNEKKRMLVLGDSFGWGFGVEHDQRFSEVLEKKHADWEIINASVSGYGTDQEYLYLKERVLKYKPDVVLLLFFVNDFHNNVENEEYWYFKPFFDPSEQGLHLRNVPVPKASVRQKLDRFFLGRTYLFARLYRAATLASASAVRIVRHRQAERGESAKVKGRDLAQPDSYLVTLEIIKSMNDLSRKNGARFVLVSAPMREKERVALHGLSTKENIAYLPLDSYFASSREKLSFPHDHHWNSTGHETAARAIEHLLEDLNIF